MNLNDFVGSFVSKLTLKCGYFPKKVAQEMVLQTENPPPELTGFFLELGFRRYGKVFYKSECPGCRQCMSYRVLVDKFSLTKSLKRVLRKNRDLRFEWSLPRFSLSKAKLYLKYIWNQHRDSETDKKSFKKKWWIHEHLRILKEQLYTPIRGTLELTVYLNALLVGFAIFDSTPKALSAVYSVYDTDYRERSLGTAIILEGWRYALKNQIPYYYLGYYIPDSRKMNYKKKFGPAEIFNPFTWEWMDAEKAEKLILESVEREKSMGVKTSAHG